MEVTNTQGHPSRGGGTQKVTVAVIAILVMVLLGWVVYATMNGEQNGGLGSVPQTLLPPKESGGEQALVPQVGQPSFSTDSVVDAIESEMDAELSSVGQELSAEETLAGAEAEALNDLNQSYDESQY